MKNIKTFWELISGECPSSEEREDEYIINIPIIQRDYAQGRQSEEQKRDLFLQELFDHLDKPKHIHLDFIYGRVERQDKKLVFFPIDGQQRLTTLYLLHWYIGLKEGIKENQNEDFMKLKNFIYETRLSSRYFCESLIEKDIVLPRVKEDTIDSVITSSYWFRDSWKSDPTVKSMLVMLQAIHSTFFQTKEFWPRLTKKRLITFHVLDMGERGFKLKDELYIKMNARGKGLTDFEDFKADLVSWMEEDNKNNDEAKSEYYLSISRKIDNDWTDFFWQKTKEYIDKRVDPLFIRLIYRYFFLKYIFPLKNKSSSAIEEEDGYDILYHEKEYQNFKVFKNILKDNPDLINNFETFFDELVEHWEDIRESSIPSWYRNEENKPSFLKGNKRTFLNKKFEQKDRVVFLAIVLFLEQKKDFKYFKQWLRVVWNIVENSNINNAESMIGAMKLIKELSQYANDIYVNLAEKGDKIKSGFSEIAVAEEIEKSRYINDDPIWESEFIKAEEHPFFKGAISFIIDDNMTLEIFKHRREMGFNIFDENGINKVYRSDGHIFLRALISRYATWDIIRKNFTDTNKHGPYLKKMLATDEVVKKAIIEWFDNIKDIDELKEILNESLKNKSANNQSEIQECLHNNKWEEVRIRRAHEELYTSHELQDWMQESGSIRFDWRYEHWYIFRPGAWYDRIMLDTCRNKVIGYLVNNQFGAKSRIKQTSYFWGYDIEVSGSINNNEYRITFDYIKTLKIEMKDKNGNWKVIASCDDYIKKEYDGLIEILEREIF